MVVLSVLVVSRERAAENARDEREIGGGGGEVAKQSEHYALMMQAAVVMHLPIPSNNCCRPSFLTSSSSTIILPAQVRPLQLRRYSSSDRSSMTVRAELQTTNPTSAATVTSSSSSIATHQVTVHDRQRGLVHEFVVPEDQYILHTAESQNISLPFACRHGCCTSCAVRVRSGQIRQPEALGISAELKAKGYALLCVGFPSSDIEVETQDEDEVYWLQFGRYFARGPIERDDYALELAMGDE